MSHQSPGANSVSPIQRTTPQMPFLREPAPAPISSASRTLSPTRSARPPPRSLDERFSPPPSSPLFFSRLRPPPFSLSLLPPIRLPPIADLPLPPLPPRPPGPPGPSSVTPSTFLYRFSVFARPEGACGLARLLIGSLRRSADISIVGIPPLRETVSRDPTAISSALPPDRWPVAGLRGANAIKPKQP